MPWYYIAIISVLLVVSLLTTATGSLLRVAARLKYFTCVLVSKAFAKSFRVGIGIFLKDKNVKHYYILVFRKFSPLIKYICTFFFALKCIQKLCNIQPLVYNWKQTTQPPSYLFDFSIMVQTVGIEQSIHHCFSSIEVKEILFLIICIMRSQPLSTQSGSTFLQRERCGNLLMMIPEADDILFSVTQAVRY